MLGVRKVVWAQRPVKWWKGLGQPWLGVDPREKQDNPTKMALPRSAVFTQPCYWFCIAFCSAAWEPEQRSRNWRGSRIQDWHICLGGSLSGRPGSDGRLFCLADGRLGAGQGVRVDRSWLWCGCLCLCLLKLSSTSSVIKIHTEAGELGIKQTEDSNPDTIPAHHMNFEQVPMSWTTS